MLKISFIINSIIVLLVLYYKYTIYVIVHSLYIFFIKIFISGKVLLILLCFVIFISLHSSY